MAKRGRCAVCGEELKYDERDLEPSYGEPRGSGRSVPIAGTGRCPAGHEQPTRE